MLGTLSHLVGKHRCGMTTRSEFPDVTVFDEIEPCPYLDDQRARLPLQVPSHSVTPSETDARLAAGQRRTGEFVYNIHCPKCQACKPIRLRPHRVKRSRTHRRTLKRNDQCLETRVSAVQVDPTRIELFNLHRAKRGLGREASAIDTEEYAWAFRRSCFDTFEISYWLDGQLVCVSICDRGYASLSAVYTYYDPALAKLSLGTYSILKQIEFCRQTGREFLYLGFYIAESRHMSYKGQFLPNERLQDGQWKEFVEPPARHPLVSLSQISDALDRPS